MKPTAYLTLLLVFFANLLFATDEHPCSKKLHTYYYLHTAPSSDFGMLVDPEAPDAVVDNVCVANSFYNGGSGLEDVCVNKSYGVVKFAVDWSRTEVFVKKAYKAVVTFDVDYHTRDLTHVTPSECITLEVYYDPTQDSPTIKSESNYIIRDAIRVNFLVKSLTFFNLDGSVLSSEDADFFPENLTLEAQVHSELFSTLTYDTIDEDVFNHVDDPACDATKVDLGDHYLFTWCAISNAEEYDLEWTFVPTLSAEPDNFLFPGNSTRVRVNKPTFNIPKIYSEQGKLVWRVRAVFRNCTNPDELVFSDWNIPDNGQISVINDVDEPIPMYNWNSDTYNGVDAVSSTPIAPHEDVKNWQYSISFAEDGKYKEVIGYADGTLRNRQTVTRISTNDSVLVAQKYYDWQGRPAIDALPAPVYNRGINYDDISSDYPNTPELKYYSNFNGDFNILDFDVNSDGCTINPQPMTAGADYYYSEDNSNKKGKNRFIPNANGYPYVQTEYTPDNTGRIRAKSGLGSDYKIGSGHETKFFYGLPLQAQLDRLFGNEVGFANHYTKEMTIDGNNTISVAYKDASGRVIATSLAGNPDLSSSLNPLASSDATYDLTSDLLYSYNSITSAGTTDNTIVSTFTHLVTSAGSHTFNYSFEAQRYSLCSLCYDCVYDLTLSVTDECGEEMVPEVYRNTTIGPVIADGSCENEEFQLGEFSITLPVGVYVITKKLKVNEDAIYRYLDYHLENSTCVNTYEEFAEEYDPGVVNDCDEPCEDCFTPTACDVFKQFLINDVTPGGQYADFFRSGDGTTTTPYTTETNRPGTLNQYSIFYTGNANGDLLIDPDDVDEAKVPNYSTLSFSATINGVTKPFKDWTPNQIFANFDPEWAKELIVLHPEHCYYDYCVDNLDSKDISDPADSTSGNYDMAFMAMIDFAEANTRGYLDPINSYGSSSFSFSSPDDIDPNSTYIDPYFAHNSAARSIMAGLMDDFNGTGHDIWEFASWMQYGTYAAPSSGCLSNSYWGIFKSLYLSKKAEVIQGQANSTCDDNYLDGNLGDCTTASGCASETEEYCDCSRRIVYSFATPPYNGVTGFPSVNGGDVNGQDFDAMNSTVNGLMGDQIEQNCYSMRLGWKSKLLECPELDDFLNDEDNLAADTAEFNDLLKILAIICTNGAGPTDVFGANSCDPFLYSIRTFANREVYSSTPTLHTFSSFSATLTFYLNRWGISLDGDCNPFMINMPMEANHGYFGTQPLDKCACEFLLDQENAFNGSSPSSGVCTLEEYIDLNPDYANLNISQGWLVDCYLKNHIDELPRSFNNMNCSDAARIAYKWLSEDVGRGSDINGTTEQGDFKQYLIDHGMAESGDNAVLIATKANDCLDAVPDNVLTYDGVPQVPAVIACDNCLDCTEINRLWLQFSRTGIVGAADLQYPFNPDYAYLTAFTNYINQTEGTNFYSFEIFDLVKQCHEASDGGAATGASSAIARMSNEIIDSTDFDTFVAIDSLTALKIDSLFLSTTDSLLCPYDLKVQLIEDTTLFDGYQYRITIKATGSCTALRNDLILDVYPMAKLDTIQFGRLDTTWTFLPIHLDDSTKFSGGAKMRVAGEPDLYAGAAIFASRNIVAAPIRPCTPTGANLVVNGDFENENTDFLSQLTYTTGNPVTNNYTISKETPGAAGCLDHTPSPGLKMFIANSPSNSSNYVWGQDITVTANTNYVFTYWAQTYADENAPQLITKINGTQVGSTTVLPSTVCQWVQFSVEWNSGVATTAQVRIYDAITSIKGNDIVLDDISMYSCGGAMNPKPPVTVNPFPAIELCNHSMMPEISYEVPSCDDYYQQMSDFLTQQAYLNYLNDYKETFKKKYSEKCLKAINSEQYTMNYTDREYHFTLYFYDQAGNLIRTVPPAGVNIIDLNAANYDVDQVDLDPNPSTNPDDADYVYVPTFPNTVQGKIDAYRFPAHPGFEDENTHAPYLPEHIMPTDYRFNTLNQVVWQDMPDAEYTQFWYDKLGRIILSQSGRQRDIGNHLGTPGTYKVFSYTLYDKLGRIYEVGQLTSCLGTEDGFPANMVEDNLVIDMDIYVDWVNSSTRTEITRTFYDAPVYAIDGFTPKNLRGRVATVTIARNNIYADLPIDEDDEFSPTVHLPLYDEAFHYSYDIHGNVNTLIEETPALNEYGQRFTRTDYSYDLISGKVNMVAYQRGKVDQFYHKYGYDADNRITDVYTSNDSLIWKKQANYDYYVHGPLARTELGDLRVQGLDYAYTIQGWLKAVNAASLNEQRDMGEDGNIASSDPNPNEYAARDAFGFALFYNNGDYQGIGGSGLPFLPESAPGSEVEDHLDDFGLYNGNIAGMQVALESNDKNPLPTVFNMYKYDQLNRISSKMVAKSPTFHVMADNSWAGVTSDFYQFEAFSYDPNGNIIEAARVGDQTWNTLIGSVMDIFTYNYEPETNKLTHVDDEVGLNDHYPEDIDDQEEGNYDYDADGNLVYDAAEQIDKIEWTAYGKIWKITRAAGSTKPDLEFEYNPAGQRTLKISKPAGLLNQPQNWTYTYYRRDASGNIMANYNVAYGANMYMNIINHNIYGSSRLGVENKKDIIASDNALIPPVAMPTIVAPNDRPAYHAFNSELMVADDVPYDAMTHLFGIDEAGVRDFTYGNINYELSNHLGNVLTTISDKILPKGDGGTVPAVAYFAPDVLSTQDYYAFGSLIPERSGEANCVPCGVLAQAIKNTYASTLDDTWTNSAYMTNITAEFTSRGFTLPGGIDDMADVLALCSLTAQNPESTGEVDMVWDDDADRKRTICPDGSLSFTNDYDQYNYRFGFNGQERDDDIAGKGNMNTAEFWEYDARLGRRWNTDPVVKPWESLYATFSDNPIFFSDPNGDDVEGGGGGETVTAYHSTGSKAGLGILEEGFKTKSGWNYFMTDASGKKAGKAAASDPIQFEVKIDTKGATEIPYDKWNSFFNDAKAEKGWGDIPNGDLTVSQRGEVDALRNVKARAYMSSIDSDAFVISVEKGANGQKFVVLTNDAARTRVALTRITKGADILLGRALHKFNRIIASAGTTGASAAADAARVAKLTRIANIGRTIITIATETILIEAFIYTMNYRHQASIDYVKKAKAQGKTWFTDSYSDVGLLYWYWYE